MDRGRILHSKKSSLSCLGYVSILKATRQKQTRLVGNLSKILLLFSLHQLVTKNEYLSTNISHIFCYSHNCHQAVSFFSNCGNINVGWHLVFCYWFFVFGNCNEKISEYVIVRQIMSSLKNSKCATPSFVFRARHRRRKQATQGRRNLGHKKSHFIHRLQIAIWTIFRKSADWLDWPAL